MNKDTIIQHFVDSTILHGKYTLLGDYENANIVYGEIIKSLKHLYEVDPKFSGLVQLLDHNNDSVRLWVATELLFTDNKDMAKKILKKMSKKDGVLSFDASMTVKEWQANRLKPLHTL